MGEQISAGFHVRAHEALGRETLQQALNKAKGKFVGARARARDELEEFDALRDEAVRVKTHVLANLDVYLETLTSQVEALGGRVHFARNALEARAAILALCAQEKARKITKGKSMISEEIGLNAALEEAGYEVIETDLGEYIIQLRVERPSHIIAPAVHLTKDEIEADFRQYHDHLDPERSLSEPESLLAEARAILREHFLSADIGITGANFLIADSGAIVLVTNEGNGDLTQTMARRHIVVASLDKVLPTMADAALMLRLLARSATGQELSVYTTFAAGPKRLDDPDGPQSFDLVILDNGRTNLLGTAFEEALRCLRCGACLNHCPVYQSVGGHAYGWIYPGPIGSVMTPALTSLESSYALPQASSLCGRCEEVCPVRIPLPKLLRLWREKEVQNKLQSRKQRLMMALWAQTAQRPALYHMLTRLLIGMLYVLGGKGGRFRRLPFMGAWTDYRDMAAPERATTFQQAWKASQAKQNHDKR